MKKILLIIFIFCLCFVNSYSQWEPCNNGLDKVGNINTIAISGNNIFVGSKIKGIYLSTNNGNNWSQVNNGLTYTGVNCIAINNSNIYTGTVNGGIFKSTDNGDNWNQINAGLTCNYISDFAIYGDNIYAGTTCGIFFSSNKGSSWSDISSGLSNKNVTCLAVTGNNIFAGIYGEGIYLSTNNGKNWDKINIGIEKVFINISRLAVVEENIFAGIGAYGIYSSSDNGNNWYCVKSSSDSTYCFGIKDENIITGTYKNLFLSTNNGQIWQDIRGDIPQVYIIISLAINDKYIFACTGNGAIFRADIHNFISLSLGKINDVVLNHDTSITINLPLIVTNPKILKFNINSDNTALLPPDSLKVTITDTSNFMIITPVKRKSGEANITLIFKSGSDSVFTTFKVTVNKPSKIDDFNLNNTISIYPNPAESTLSIVSNNKVTHGIIEIYNLMGIKVFCIVELNNRSEIDISTLPIGIYLVKIGEYRKIFVKN